MKTLSYSFTLIINVQGKDTAAALKKKKLHPKYYVWSSSGQEIVHVLENKSICFFYIN